MILVISNFEGRVVESVLIAGSIGGRRQREEDEERTRGGEEEGEERERKRRTNLEYKTQEKAAR